MKTAWVCAAWAGIAILGCSKEALEPEPSKGAGDEGRLARPKWTTAEEPDDVSFHVPKAIVVDFADGTQKSQFDEWERAWGVDLELADEEEGVDSAITVGTFEGDLDALIAQVRQNSAVEVAEPLMRFSANFTPNDPMFEQQWNLNLIRMPKAWDVNHGRGVTVAVLDTGVAYEDYEDFRAVPDLRGVRIAKGFDFVNNDRHANDDHGHGTHVAGTIAQATNNGEGVAGVAFEATLMPVKVLDHFGSGTSAHIADAIRWAADHGARVINMSLGGGGRSLVMEKAVEYARAKGAVVVCAAGNGGRGLVEFPAAYPGSIAVGAVGPDGTRAPYSSWGKALDIAAPGGDKSQGDGAGVLQNTIDPQDPGKSVYAAFQGTSMATPHVAGVAALLFAAGAKSAEQVEKALFLSAHPAAGSSGWTEQYGHGVLDAQGALDALRMLAMESLAVEPPRYSPTEWRPVVWAGLLLAFVLLTLGRKERPGYLNVVASPGFLIPLLVSTVGVFVVQYVAAPSELSTSLILPLPDWLNRIIFGRGSLANPIVYSAALPVVACLVGARAKGFRAAAGGVAIGFAAILAYSAWAKAPPLAWLPFTFMAIPWLLGNALICLFLARAMLRREPA